MSNEIELDQVEEILEEQVNSGCVDRMEKDGQIYYKLSQKGYEEIAKRLANLFVKHGFKITPKGEKMIMEIAKGNVTDEYAKIITGMERYDYGEK